MNVLNQLINGKYALYHGDAVEITKELPDNSIHYSIFSPPFSSLYTYSNSERDMGNSKNHNEFYIHFEYLIRELYRVTLPGRLLSFHCMNIPYMKERDGYIGLHDFRGELIRLFTDSRWIFHSEVCIWKDPLIEATRTKSIGLMHKQLVKDSSISKQGSPDFLITMRKPGANQEPISHGRGIESFIGEEEPQQPKNNDPSKNTYSHHVWRRYASPVWMDIRQTRTLQYRGARDSNDERHICPLQLDVIERALTLWTNPDDIVFSPFGGVGSEGYSAIKMGRRTVCCELKESYFNQMVKNIRAINESIQHDLFIND